jgi:hypothetical protein
MVNYSGYFGAEADIRPAWSPREHALALWDDVLGNGEALLYWTEASWSFE